MVISESEVQMMSDYFRNSFQNGEGMHTYFMGHYFSWPYLEKIMNMYPEYFLSASSDLDSLQVLSLSDLAIYDLFVLSKHGPYHVREAMRLQRYAKEVSFSGNKSVVAAYYYDLLHTHSNHQTHHGELKLFYENPYFSSSEVIPIFSSRFHDEDVLNLASFQYHKKNKEYIKKL